MGYYVQTGTLHDKAEIIAREHGGVIIEPPPSFDSIPEEMALICVVDNGPFEAAALLFDAGEFDAFTEPGDPRDREYVLLGRETAYRLAGYLPKNSWFST